jgi:hypothetical protein
LLKKQNRFQWAALQIRQLLSLQREDFIRARLGKLPKDLEATYDEIFATIEVQDEGKPDIAIRAFQWVTCSARPLSPAEFVVAVCQDPDVDDPQGVDIDINFVLSACQNLLDIKESGDVVKFAHLSVREYFEKLKSGTQADNSVAKVCLSLLNYSDNWEKNSRRDEKSQTLQPVELLRYVRVHWPIHVQRCGEATTDSRVSMLVQKFLGSMNESGLAYRSWYRMVKDEPETSYQWKYDLQPSEVSSLAICLFGLYHPLLQWWKLGFTNIEQRNRVGDSLLTLAVLGGHTAIVELLLGKGADVNAQGGRYGNALEAASYGGHTAIVELLRNSL